MSLGNNSKTSGFGGDLYPKPKEDKIIELLEENIKKEKRIIELLEYILSDIKTIKWNTI